jgi:glycosyltransferase involved in cell wall biosynthesis
MSNSVLEACAAGAAVLITPGCNFPEAARCEAGCVVEPQPKAVAEALAGMLADRPRLRAMGENGRDMVRRRFSIPAVVERIEGMYEAVARKGRSVTRAAA